MPSQKKPIFSISRRELLRGAAGAALLGGAPGFVHALGDLQAGSLFTLGVASGDPTAHSVVLWTRIAPEPLSGGGLGKRKVPVEIEVALDPGFIHVIRSGRRLARPEFGHIINVLVGGLPPDTWLYYRFRALGQVSRTGITRTFPRAMDSADQVRFAVVSCQNYNQGFYTAYADIVEQNVDFVVHTGDYIYEGGPPDIEIAPDRSHDGSEIFSVEDYRNRYAQYRLDPDLQRAHAAVPFLVTWDDHEVENNYAGLNDENGSEPEEFARRRRDAYRVYRESMPLRPANRAQRPDELRIYRSLPFGDLADIHLLDTRQYRTDQPAGDNFGSADDLLTPVEQATLEAVFGETLFDRDGLLNDRATLLGAKQEAWLARQLRQSDAQWNILAQQIMVMRWNLAETGRLSARLGAFPQMLPQPVQDALGRLDTLFNVDAWDGYRAARERLFTLIDRANPSNPVVLTGDIHSSWGANLLSDFDDPTSRMIAAEFVCTSISSTFLSLDPRPTHEIVSRGVVKDNPHIEYFNGLFRGYALCDVDRDRWQTTYRTVESASLSLREALAAPPGSGALIPYPGAEVTTDAVLRLQSGFRDDNGRLETVLARTFPNLLPFLV
jgi:alkaline phosphatase D